MGERRGVPNTNEIAAFVDRYVPSLRDDRDGDFASVLAPGVIGGEEDRDDAALVAALRVRGEVIAAALGPAVEKANSALERARIRLKTVKRLRFASAVFASVSSAGALTTLFAAGSQAAAIAALVITLGASIVGAAADILILGGAERETQINEAIQALASVIGKADLTAKLVSGFLKIEFSVSEMQTLIGQANDYFGTLNDALAKID